MNEQKFNQWMHAIDDDLLEEAQRPVKHRSIKIGWLAAAACICFTVAGAVWQMRSQTVLPESGLTLSNPVQIVTQAELENLGYSMPQPAGAQDLVYTTVSQGEGAVPMAQVTFLKNEQEYTCRALQTDTQQDISGIYADWSETLDWTVDTLSMEYRSSDSAAFVSWYSPEAQTQWCLSASDTDKLTLMSTANEIVEALGYDVNVAPAGAADVAYQVFLMQDLTVAETTFVLNGAKYVFRMAATLEVSEDFADISGEKKAYAVNKSGEVGWCPARLSYDEGEGGKIIWFDVVPGILYSLSVDTGASEDALTQMALQLFEPAQDHIQ